MLKCFKILIIFAMVFPFVVGCANSTDEGTEDNNNSNIEDNKDVTITFGVTPWTTTIPPTKIAKLILEDMGYTIKEISADAGGVYAGLSTGDIDVFMDAWLPDMHRNYLEQFGDNIDDVSVSYPDGELGWVIPTYVEDVNSLEDIKGNEGMFENNIYGIEEGAGMTATSREMIEAYDLDLEYVASSEGGMLAQASKIIQNEKPVIFLGWRPHPMFVNYDLKVLEDPQEFFKTSEVHILTNNGLKEKAPEAYEFLSNWSIDVGEIEKMIVENDERDSEEVAREWIDENQDLVDAMLGE
ncbi:MAG: glycine betaine ABC transporter substrate-binding protein [Eubacteriales bacterium]